MVIYYVFTGILAVALVALCAFAIADIKKAEETIKNLKKTLHEVEEKYYATMKDMERELDLKDTRIRSLECEVKNLRERIKLMNVCPANDAPTESNNEKKEGSLVKTNDEGAVITKEQYKKARAKRVTKKNEKKQE